MRAARRPRGSAGEPYNGSTVPYRNERSEHQGNEVVREQHLVTPIRATCVSSTTNISSGAIAPNGGQRICLGPRAASPPGSSAALIDVRSPQPSCDIPPDKSRTLVRHWRQ